MKDHAKRRIIVNDDGETRYTPRAREGVEAFLSQRFTPCVGTPVDTYFWCIGNGEEPPWGNAIPEEIGDPNTVMIDAARKAGIEIFVSVRMNDTHDAFEPELSYPLKVERPELLLGAGLDRSLLTLDDDAAVMRQVWSGLDYAHQEVRDHKGGYIERVCRQYDFDGLELDFGRCPPVFKLGEEEKHTETMTGFVRGIRQTLEKIGADRGRPHLLTARVPDTPALARALGYDVERWLSEGLLDLLIAGVGTSCMASPHGELIELGHRHGVPVYPCIDTSYPLEGLRAVAGNFLAAGADGVYRFNYSPTEGGGEPPPGSSWSILHPDEEREPLNVREWSNEISDAQTLSGLDKLYRLEWGRVAAKYYCASSPHPLPVSIMERRRLRLVVGDDIEEAARNGRLGELCLEVRVSGIQPHEGITLHVNGVAVAGGEGSPFDAYEDCFCRTVRTVPAGCWYDVAVGAPPLHKGANEIVVAPGLKSIGSRASTVDRMQLRVRYR